MDGLRLSRPPSSNGDLVDHTVVLCEGPGRLSLLTVGEDGTTPPQPLSIQGLWPCWSPDGQNLAISTLQTGSREVRGSIELLDSNGAEVRTAHQAVPGAPPVIAPRVPHYVQWSPDSSTLSFVAPGSEALGLFLSDRGGSYNSDRVAAGAPLFSSWSDDSGLMAIHAGADLSTYNVKTRVTIPITRNAVGFRTPIFAENRLIYAMSSPPGVTVFSASPVAPDDVREIARFDGGIVLQAVGGETPGIAVCVTREPDSGTFNELLLLNPGGGAPSRVARGPFAAALWSPRGDRVAVVSPTQTGDGRYAIQVYDRTGRYVAATESIVPSQDYRTYLGFFDQYSLSHHLWSPDGTALLCCGRLPGDGSAWSFTDRQDDYCWYWRVAPNSPFVRLGTGDCAFFRP